MPIVGNFLLVQFIATGGVGVSAWVYRARFHYPSGSGVCAMSPASPSTEARLGEPEAYVRPLILAAP